MRKFRYILVTFAALGVGLAACTKENQEAEQTPAIYEQGFAFGTRADGDETVPEHGDAFTLMSYRVANASSTNDYSYKITSISGIQQYGYYAYVNNGGTDFAGDLIPVTVSQTTYEATSLSRNYTNAQKLLGVPISGTNPNLQGHYHVAMIFPAIPVKSTTEHGYLAVYKRNDDIYASHPDDKSGDGDATNDPFKIIVSENMDVHDASEVKLFPVKAQIRIYLFSHFYEDGDDDFEYPKEVEFEVENLLEDIKLVNAGSNGWFNPRTRVIYPNYNYVTPASYSSTVTVSSEGQNAEPMEVQLLGNDVEVPTRYGDKKAKAKYLIDEVPVFPTDYRGSEGGGNPYIIPMTLSLKLKQTGNEAYNNASVPIALNIENNKVYTFYVNVKSTMINVTYTISDWVPAGGTYGDLGGNVMEYMEVKLQNQSGDWTPKDGGSSTIGGDNQ